MDESLKRGLCDANFVFSSHLSSPKKCPRHSTPPPPSWDTLIVNASTESSLLPFPVDNEISSMHPSSNSHPSSSNLSDNPLMKMTNPFRVLSKFSTTYVPLKSTLTPLNLILTISFPPPFISWPPSMTPWTSMIKDSIIVSYPSHLTTSPSHISSVPSTAC